MRLLLAAALALIASVASAQTVRQNGAVTTFHVPIWASNGHVQDGGGATTPMVSNLGVFSGTTCPVNISSQTTPGATSAAYSQMLFCPTNTDITVLVQGVNGQPNPTLHFNVGGVSYAFPGTGTGNVNGPVSSTNNDFASFNGTGGSLLADSGVSLSIAANSLLGNATGSTATLAAVSLPNCHSTNQALNWTAASGFTCQTIAGSGSGSVTSVATGVGLTGGPITTTGTISATTALNAQVGTTYTVLAGDSAGIVTLNNGSAIAVTLPQATGSFGAGYATTLCDIGAGTATITPTTSTIGGAATYTLTSGNCVTPVSDGSNYAIIQSTGQKIGYFNNVELTASASAAGDGIYNATTHAVNVSVNGASVGQFTSTGLNSAAVGATTTSTGAFTTLSASSTVSGTGFSTYLASPPAIGGTVAAAGTFTSDTANNILLAASQSASGDGIYNGATHETDVSVNGSKVAGFTSTGLNAAAVGATTASTGAFTTLSASGLLGATGSFVCISGGVFSTQAGSCVANATSQAQPSAPTAPASTASYTMQGLAGAITPSKTGKVLITISGTIIAASTTVNDGILYQISYGTGSAPTNGAALTGTQAGAIQEYTNPATITAADLHVPFSLSVVVTGLTVSTAYWIDLAAKSVTNASDEGLTGVSISVIEL